MRRTSVIAAAVAAVILAIAGTASAPASSTCSAARGKTIASNSRARVYFVPSRNDATFGLLLGCSRSTGRRYDIDSGDVFRKDVIVRLAGSIVAVADNGGDSLNTIFLWNLAGKGHEINQTELVQQYYYDHPSVTDLVVSSGGNAAWIVTNIDAGNNANGVGALDRGGKRLRTLDQDGSVTPHTLRLSGHSLSWRSHGAVRTMTLG